MKLTGIKLRCGLPALRRPKLSRGRLILLCAAAAQGLGLSLEQLSLIHI